MRSSRLLRAAAMALLVAGCAGFDIPPGTPRQQVLERMGRPARVVALPGGGERLQYSYQPFGQVAWMVDIDSAGRVVRVVQALTEASFHRIEAGKWTREDIEREFGRPATIDGVASWKGPIWTYRWRDRQGADMFYWVYFDEGGVVRRAHPGMDPVNAPADRR